MATWKAQLCLQCGADKFGQVSSHIQHSHSYNTNFSITCGVDGCKVTLEFQLIDLICSNVRNSEGRHYACVDIRREHVAEETVI